MKKRFVHLLLTMVLLVSLLPVVASAATVDPFWCEMGGGHFWNENGVCTDCDTVCEHEFKNGVCSDCGAPCEHAFKDGVCSTCGYVCKHKFNDGVCTGCNFECKHNPVEVPGYAATCTKEGRTSGKKCSVCDKALVSQKRIPMLAHDYNKAEPVAVVTKPTCTAKGVITAKCKTCTATDNFYVDATGHTKVTFAGYAATCTKEGRTDGTKCSVCNTVLKSQRVIPMIAHDYDETTPYEVVLEVKCTERGIHRYKCKHCDATKKVNVEPTGHTEVEIPATPATCAYAAKTAGKKCTVCDATTVAPQAYGNGLGHDYTVYVKTLTEVTCTTDGTDLYKCSRCNATNEKTVTKGHDFMEYKIMDPTCTAVGHIFKLCQRCELVETVRVAATGHEAVDVEATDATCTNVGMTAGEKCSKCDAVLVAQEVIPMLPHEWEEKDAVAATCKADGYTAHKECAVCHETEGKQVVAASAAGHKFERFKCVICNAYDTAHNHQETCVNTSAPTCTAAGAKTYYCEACGYMRSESIAALQHNFVGGICTRCNTGNPDCDHSMKVQTGAVDPTCMTPGSATYHCPCGHSEVIPVSATGHHYVSDKCINCGETDPNAGNSGSGNENYDAYKYHTQDNLLINIIGGASKG